MTPDEAPLQTNAADEAQVSDGRHYEQDAERHLIADDRDELSTAVGRRRLWRRIAACGVFSEIDGDPAQVQRALGRRSVGLELLARAMRHRDLFLQMQNEELKRIDEAQRARSSRRMKKTSM